MSSQPPCHKEELSTFSWGEMSPSRKIYFFIIIHDRDFIPTSEILTAGLSSPVTCVRGFFFTV